MDAKEKKKRSEGGGQYSYPPPKRKGTIFQTAGMAAFAGGSAACFLLAAQEPLGMVFVLLLLGGLGCSLPAMFFGRRLRALRGANYLLDREGLRILWGAREEHIPMQQIQWVRLEETLEAPLSLPRPRWPGAVLGRRGHITWGEMEFLAAQGEELVLIGTGKRVFVISPEMRDEFIQRFREMIELGSLKGMEARSIHPVYLLQDVWKPGRSGLLLMLSVGVNAAMLLVTAWRAPGIETISLGFTPSGAPLPAVPGIQLYLLPIASLVFLAATFVAAGIAQRREANSPYPAILFTTNLLSSSLFISALLILLARV